MNRALCALGAFAVASAAVTGPVDGLANRSFAWHMAQHLTLFFVVPLLALLAQPFALFRRVAGNRVTALAVRATRPFHAFASPPVALAVVLGVLWGTHFSSLYEAALDDVGVHAAEHALYVLAGFAFWLPVLNVPPLRPLSYPIRLLYLIVALPQGALLAMAIGSARAPLYPHYAALLPPGAAIADQQNAAAVMWIAGGLAVFVALLATLGVWASRETRAEGLY